MLSGQACRLNYSAAFLTQGIRRLFVYLFAGRNVAGPEPPMKQQNVVGAITAPGHVSTAPGEVRNSSCYEANITVHTMSGAILAEMCIQHVLLGQDLLNAMLELLQPTGIGIAKLLHGAGRIDTSRPAFGPRCR